MKTLHMTYSTFLKDHGIRKRRAIVEMIAIFLMVIFDVYLELAIRLGWASWNALDEAPLLPKTCARWQAILLLRLSVDPIQLRCNKIFHFLVVRICKTVSLGLLKKMLPKI